jgi:glycosyltransferase involved in cell wall biosynthesis
LLERTKTRTVIIVSPYFPPSGVAGVHRARHLAKHLPSAGWTPVVLCVNEAHHEQRLDPSLGALVSAETEIVKVGAIPAKFTRPFGVGEISLRAWFQLSGKLSELLSRRPVHAVMITGSPYFPMLLARRMKRRFRVPVLLDFQDPWVSTWGETQPALSKSGISHALAKTLEPRALRNADYVTSVSEVQNAELAARYPWINSERMAAIPIGSDADEFRVSRTMTTRVGTVPLPPENIHLSYVGTIWPGVLGSVRALLRAFAKLRASDPRLAARIRLNFVGTNADPNNVTTKRVVPLAQTEGVADAVCEFPARLPYLEALSVLARSHGLLLIGSDEPHYTASKIYPALMSQRPYVSLYHRASSAHAILSAAGGGLALAFERSADLADLEAPLAEALRTLALQPDTLGAAEPAAYAPYEAHNIARRFAAIFESMAPAADGRRDRVPCASPS